MKKTTLMMMAIGMMATDAAFAQTTQPSMLQTAFKDTAISVKAGTSGVGFDLTKSVNDYFKVRAGYSELKVNKDYTRDEITYDGKLKLGGWDLLADYHPFAGGFRVTGGVYGAKTRFGASAQYTGIGTIEINEHIYTSNQVPNLQAEVKWNKVKPYFGLGYDGFNSQKNGGLFFTADVGVVFSGTPQVMLNATCGSVSAAVCTQLASDVQAERASIVSDVKDARWLPVIQVGVGYRF